MAPVEGHTQFALLLQSCNLVAIVVHAGEVAMRPPWDAARDRIGRLSARTKARAFSRHGLPSPDRGVDRGKGRGVEVVLANEAMLPSVQASPARATCARDPRSPCGRDR